MAFGLLGVVALVATVAPLTAYAWLARRWEAHAAYLAVAGLPAAGLVVAYLAYASASYFFVLPLFASVWASGVLTALGLGLWWRARRRRATRRERLRLAGAACLAAVPLLLAVGDRVVGAARGPARAYYRHMAVDPASLQVTLSGPLALAETHETPHFLRLRGPTFVTIDHYAAARPGAPPTRYNAFAVGLDGRLRSRTKHQRLLHGPFGMVYARSVFRYAPGAREPAPDVETAGWANAVPHEPPATVVEAMLGAGRPPDAVSLVRVLVGPPEFLVVSANYDAAGAIRSIHVNGARHGDWVHSSEIGEPYRRLGVATMLGDRPEVRTHYGLPPAMPWERAARLGTRVFATAPLPVHLDAVHLHYDRGRLVRQHVSRSGAPPESRDLRFHVTAQDLALSVRDDRAAARR